MDILVLGGTQFLGRHFVEAAQKRGHRLTLFNRGQTHPELFPDIEKIVGDRTQDIGKLRGRPFDAVVDTSGYFPKNLEDVTSELKVSVDKYVFISSSSVFDYNDKSLQSFDETGTLVNLDVDLTSDTQETYGARKYRCEEVVARTFVDNHLIVRPGLIVGPYDPTNRFPYWADRIAEGGRVLCPGDPEAPLQFIDARDLSQWIVLAIETSQVGVFNAVSPYNSLTFGDFLEAVRLEINPEASLEWVDEDFLRKNEITCWTELPLWVYKDIQGFLKVNSDKAMGLGLKFRPLGDSIRETHNWSQGLDKKSQFMGRVLSREKEKQLLESFKTKNAQNTE